MSRISVQRTGPLTQGEDIASDSRRTIDQAVDQINAGPATVAYALKGQKLVLPRGARRGSMASRPTATGLAVRVFGDRGTSKEVEIPSDLSSTLSGLDTDVEFLLHYKGLQTGTAPPTTTEFPADGDYGWFIDTTPAPDVIYFAYNNSGTIITPSVSVSLNFTDIAGTITATQHGALTTNATASHSNATTSQAGFFSATDKTKLDNATDAATVSTLAFRDASADIAFRRVTADGNSFGTSGFFDATSNTGIDGHYRVEGTRVVSIRQAAIADATGTLGNAVTTINSILAAMRASTGHGLIAG